MYLKLVDAVNLAAVTNQDVDVNVSESAQLRILASMITDVAADLVIEVRAYDAEGAIFPQALVAVTFVGAALIGANAHHQAVFNVEGFQTIQVRTRNADAVTAHIVDTSAFSDD